MKKIGIKFLTVCLMVASLFSCNQIGQENNEISTVQATVIEIEKYGHAVLDITTEDFMKYGYELGDVISIFFNDCEYTMPFYDGYYSNPGSCLLRGTKPEAYIAVCINYGDFSVENNIAIGDSAKIKMVEKAGMRAIQELYALQYSNDPKDYSDIVTFTNFRAITAGRIGEGKLYRTSSPINNENGRADYSDDFIESVGVATVLNLSDSYEDVEKYLNDTSCDSNYYRNLYESGSVIAVDLTGNFYSEEFASSIAEGFTFLANNKTPYCIHCTEGKDRTGFAAMLLEALMGATLDEIIDDYMLTFYNYYGIDKDREPERYQAVLNVNLMAMLCHVSDVSVEKLKQTDLEIAATTYLLKAGMTNEDILKLKQALE